MKLTERVHQYLEDRLKPGDLAIDATTGNGHDSLKMAERIAPNGRLIAIDCQDAAIETSGNRLRAHHLLQLCRFLKEDHATALPALIAEHCNQAQAIVFNLGYLPGSDKSVQTAPGSTLPALNAAAELLQPGGLLLVTAYRGHPGGIEEADAVARWMQAFAGNVVCHEPDSSGQRIPPILWVATAA